MLVLDSYGPSPPALATRKFGLRFHCDMACFAVEGAVWSLCMYYRGLNNYQYHVEVPLRYHIL